MATVEEVRARLDLIGAMPAGAARSAAAEELQREVEDSGPAELLGLVHLHVVEAHEAAGEVHRSFVPFARWLQWADSHPEHLAGPELLRLLWTYRRMIYLAWDHPEVPRERIEELLDDFERRCVLAGRGLRLARLLRFRRAWNLDAPETGALLDAALATPRDELSECEYTELTDVMLFRGESGDVEGAIGLMEEALRSRPRCHGEAAWVCSYLSQLHLESGEPEPAARYLLAARQEVERVTDEDLMSTKGRIAQLLARGGHPEAAMRWVERWAPLLHDPVPGDRLGMLRFVAGAARVVARTRPDMPVTVEGVAARTAAELADWAEAEALELALRFDERDGATAAVREHRELVQLEPGPVRLELRVLAPERLEAVAAPGKGAEPAGEGAGTGPQEDAVEVRAEDVARNGDWAGAAPLFLAEAERHLAHGRLVEAARSLHGAGRCAQELGDDEGAEIVLRRSIALLRAGGGRLVERCHVAWGWAASLVRLGRPGDCLPELEDLAAELEDAGRAARTERATGHRVRAVVLGELERWAEVERLAARAAEDFAGLVRVDLAAECFALAGAACVRDGRLADAVYHLESAREGYQIVRQVEELERVTARLAEVLRELGREDEAEALTGACATR